VLTTSIQSGALLPGSPAGPTLSLQSAAPGPSSFASALQSAGALATAASNPQPATLAGRVKSVEKSPEKKTPENSKPAEPAPSSPVAVPSLNTDVKPASAIAINLQPNQTLPQGISSGIATPGLTPSPAASSDSDTKAGLAAGTSTTSTQDTMVGLASGFNQNAPAHNWGSILNEASTAAAIEPGTQAPVREASAPLNTATASVKDAAPHPPDTVRPPLTPIGQTEAVQQPAVSEDTPAPNSSSQESAGTLPSDPAALDLLIQASSASIAEVTGISGKGDPHAVPVNPTQSTLPRNAIQDGIADVASKTNPSGGDSKPQPTDASMTESAPAPPAASVVASPSFSVELSKPISLRAAAVGTKGTETISVPDVHSKEASGTRAPLNLEGAKLKSADSPSNPADANVQPPPSGPPPVSLTGQSSDAVQPSAAVTPANVSAPVLSAATQDSGSRATPPATDSQTPAPGPSAPLPPAGTVEVARLVTGAAQAEMHIGLRTQAFGSVEVHTIVRDSQVGLTVGSERGDLRTFLANEVSGLQTTLRQQDLRFDNIQFLETSSGTNAGFSSGADSQARSSNQQHSSTGGLFSIHGPPDDPPEVETGPGIRARLNVHA
jgi:hypothetical protein